MSNVKNNILKLSSRPQKPSLYALGQHTQRAHPRKRNARHHKLSPRAPDLDAILEVRSGKENPVSGCKQTPCDVVRAPTSLKWQYMMLIHPNNTQLKYQCPKRTETIIAIHHPCPDPKHHRVLGTMVYICVRKKQTTFSNSALDHQNISSMPLVNTHREHSRGNATHDTKNWHRAHLI